MEKLTSHFLLIQWIFLVKLIGKIHFSHILNLSKLPLKTVLRSTFSSASRQALTGVSSGELLPPLTW